MLSRPWFAVHIRLFVPYSLTVIPRSLKSQSYHRPPSISPSAVRGLRSIPPSAVCGPPSIFVYSFPYSLTVPYFRITFTRAVGSGVSPMRGTYEEKLDAFQNLFVFLRSDAHIAQNFAQQGANDHA
jgi:hypothetical protein